jgi:C4-type Zn-finger protein
MAVPYCYICQENEAEKRQYGDASLDQGDYCPVCHRPTCRYHMSRVRWRWKDTGTLDSALVCRDCKTSYRHRDWDAHNRDWIS